MKVIAELEEEYEEEDKEECHIVTEIYFKSLEDLVMRREELFNKLIENAKKPT